MQTVHSTMMKALIAAGAFGAAVAGYVPCVDGNDLQAWPET